VIVSYESYHESYDDIEPCESFHLDFLTSVQSLQASTCRDKMLIHSFSMVYFSQPEWQYICFI
jgi:hypothetical protein